MKYNYQANFNWHPLYNYVMIVKREYMKGNADSEEYNFNDWLDYINFIYSDEDGEIKNKIIKSLLDVFKALVILIMLCLSIRAILSLETLVSVLISLKFIMACIESAEALFLI